MVELEVYQPNSGGVAQIDFIPCDLDEYAAMSQLEPGQCPDVNLDFNDEEIFTPGAYITDQVGTSYCDYFFLRNINFSVNESHIRWAPTSLTVCFSNFTPHSFVKSTLCKSMLRPTKKIWARTVSLNKEVHFTGDGFLVHFLTLLYTFISHLLSACQPRAVQHVFLTQPIR